MAGSAFQVVLAGKRIFYIFKRLTGLFTNHGILLLSNKKCRILSFVGALPILFRSSVSLFHLTHIRLRVMERLQFR